MDAENAYESLAEATDDARWAFGTGFDDPLAGVDSTLPTGVVGSDLAAYSLMLGDDALVLAQRLAECSTHAPELEEEVALANIGLDLIGQARLLLARAAAADPAVVPLLPAGSPVPPDDALAFFRNQFGFRNVALVALPNGNFAAIIARLLVFSSWRFALLESLRSSVDPVLSAVATKGATEVLYHRDYAARWCVTLAQGTALSRERMIDGLTSVWPYVGELDLVHPIERVLLHQGVAADSKAVSNAFHGYLGSVLKAADLTEPSTGTSGAAPGRTGRDGAHTEHLGLLLDEMQSLARAHPMGRW